MDPATVITAGATNIGQLSQSMVVLSSLREIWNLAISRTMILSLAMVCAAVPCSAAMQWLNAKKSTASKTTLEGSDKPASSGSDECETTPELVD